MERRTYDQYCATARTLDLVGERWTLLLIRELLTGPKRFGDLQGSLRGLGTGLLAARLKHLEREGLAHKITLPAPAHTPAYALTDAGEELGPPIMALAGWGLKWAMDEPRTTEALQPGWAVLELQACFESEAAAGLRAVYEFHVGDDVFHARIDDGTIEARQGPAQHADASITISKAAFVRSREQSLTLVEAVELGAATATGDSEALRSFSSLFRRPPRQTRKPDPARDADHRRTDGPGLPAPEQTTAVRLVGREAERASIDGLLSRTAAGEGGALVLRGEAGVGKSALMEYAAESAAGAGMRVLRIVGVQSEAALAYAGLVSLLRPLLDLLDELPERQAQSLRGALGLAVPGRVDRLLVGHALLTLLSMAAEDQTAPLVCLVDDGQWVDQETVDALAFAARRLEVEPIAVVLAVREDERSAAAGLDELPVAALDRSAARELLATYAPGLAAIEVDRLLDEAGGNPLALREFAAMTVAGLSSGLEPSPSPIPKRVEQRFAAQVELLPDNARQLILLAAASGTGEIHLLARAAAQLGGSIGDSEPAEQAGLVRLSGHAVVFRHPLIRSAVYQQASLRSRLAAHRALAEVLDPVTDRDRKAWHTAWSVTEPDELIAAELEQTAEHARRTGGYAAMAAAYERAAELTPDNDRRAHRQAKAAHAALVAGQRDRAVGLAELARPGAGPGLGSRLDRILLEGRRVIDRDSEAARQATLKLAGELAAAEPANAAQYFFESAVLTAMTDHNATGMAAVVEGIHRACLPDLPDVRPYVRGVHGLDDLFSGRYERAMAGLRELSEWLTAVPPGSPHFGSSVYRRTLTAMLTGDLERTHHLAVRALDAVRTERAYELLPIATACLGMSERALGRFRSAEAGVLAAIDQAGAAFGHEVPYMKTELVFFAALRGEADEARRIAADVHTAAPGTTATAAAECELAFLETGLGQYEAALARLERLFDERGPYAVRMFYSWPLLVESAALAGVPERGAFACERFTAWAAATGTTWAESVALRCRALLISPVRDADAGDLYRRAVKLGQPDGSSFEQARTELLYGTWLRRARRIREARAVLRPALEAFDRLGARLWADRARNELRAAGDTTRMNQGHSRRDLTAQEFQVARLAARGLSNRDIAAQLFLSPRTVGYHLYKIFPKLGISSRRELVHLDLDDDMPLRFGDLGEAASRSTDAAAGSAT